MSPNLRRYGAMAVAVGLLVASAGSVHAQGFGVIPNQPIVNNPNFLMNPGLAQAQFLYNLQARQMINSNPYITGAAPAASVNPLVDPYTGGNIYSPGSALSPAMAPYSPYYNPYSPYPYGGFLSGAADVLKAYGTVITSQEQARIMREAAKQARLDTEKKRFDLERYIKDNTPSFTEEQAKIAKQVLRKVQNTSNPYEIWSGSSLNILLDDLRKYPSKR